ncbi:MAG: hypothetical protein H6Q42_3579 [Deltaproteobacteria bacterium]|nr:hypothetical protein [Deltaproteobacteria bacterium]
MGKTSQFSSSIWRSWFGPCPGAWGCGAFGYDPWRTAFDFRQALENEFNGAFFDIVFAIADWSPERRFLGPFREVFLS